MKSSTIIEYDKSGRIALMYFPSLGITYKYVYMKDGSRTVIVESDKNETNYRTTTNQIFVNGDYVDVKVYQEGRTYNIEMYYDEDGNEMYLKRVNKELDTEYSKKTVRSKDGKPLIWFEDYNGVKSIGFSVDLDKIVKKK